MPVLQSTGSQRQDLTDHPGYNPADPPTPSCGIHRFSFHAVCFCFASGSSIPVYKQISHETLLASTGNSAQCSVGDLVGKEIQEGGVTVYIWLIHFTYTVESKYTVRNYTPIKSNFKRKRKAVYRCLLSVWLQRPREPWAWQWDLVPGGASVPPDSKNVCAGLLSLPFSTAHDIIDAELAVSKSLTRWNSRGP